jgi:hypothetical protein
MHIGATIHVVNHVPLVVCYCRTDLTPASTSTRLVLLNHQFIPWIGRQALLGQSVRLELISRRVSAHSFPTLETRLFSLS